MEIKTFTLKIIISALLTAFSFTVGAQVREGFSGLALHKAHVFGEDNRSVENQSIFDHKPYNMIVKVGLGCTGALVGEDLVLTNYHCIHGARTIKTHFHRGSYKYRARIIEKIYEGSQAGGSKIKPENDWAILRLDKPLGRELGYFGFFEQTPDFRGMSVNLAGYSSDKSFGRVLSTHKNCSIRNYTEKYLLHDCDMMKGASGSPIWIEEQGSFYIIGLNSGQYMPPKKEPNGGRKKFSGYYGIDYEIQFSNTAVRPEKYSDVLSNELRKGNFL